GHAHERDRRDQGNFSTGVHGSPPFPCSAAFAALASAPSQLDDSLTPNRFGNSRADMKSRNSPPGHRDAIRACPVPLESRHALTFLSGACPCRNMSLSENRFPLFHSASKTRVNALMDMRSALSRLLAGGDRDGGRERPMPIDYEAEYNVRERVPEHPQIFANWTRDAE